ncbi:MAG: UDP-3-O-(3-hydroxymyristoyl)glucosamine N-acyltransferase [Bacteroidetes bacterium]|nr:UDP-3-O-(3-hydroxymyristoyl)glucosamine N-acyltransferase [Bacteroidota bacterium]
MKLQKPITLAEMAEFLGCTFVGDPQHQITGVNEIHRVTAGDLVFVDHPKYYQKALNSAATTILIDQIVECPEGKGLLVSESPFDDFNKINRQHRPFVPQLSAITGVNCKIAESAMIYPNAFIGNNVIIGENAIIHSGACIMDHTVIEENVIVGPNSVIGHYAFYYKKKPEGFDRMHSCGNVHLSKNVEIGALCTIDAGVTATTMIGEGTKIDNHVHIGHDTLIGKNCLLAANVGIAGCVELKDNVTLWGQVGCASDVVLGEGVTVLAQSGISKDLQAGKTYFGSPCGEVKSKFREMAALRRLPEILEKM